MKSLLFTLLILCAFTMTAAAQLPWIMLHEYPSPGLSAVGLYYDGKLLWNVDYESELIFTLNPYNLVIEDTIISPIDGPWGITHDGCNFWMTNTSMQPHSQLARILPDTFAVETIWDFDNYYFYGITYDSVGGHLWISAMDNSYTKYLMEFDGDSGQVVNWHNFPYAWNLGLQYWDRRLWINTSDWNYPDMTFIYDLDSMCVDEMYICPMQVPEGIATNGVVWWISHFRNNAPYIWKLVPPGTTVHDIAAHSPFMPPGPGTLPSLELTPEANFINYGSVDEQNVPFICRIKEVVSGAVVYYDSLIYLNIIPPEAIVPIQYSPTTLQPEMSYKITFYSNLFCDDYRNNDTLSLYINTIGLTQPHHDLAVLSVLEPDQNEPLGPIYPQIRVQNQGNIFEPVAPVHLTITDPNGDPTETEAQITNLAVGEIDTLIFAAFVPTVAGDHTFAFDGLLPLDENPANDSVVVHCQVGLEHDVAPIQITSPPAFTPLAPIIPRVIVQNLGDFNEPAFYTTCIVRDSSAEVYNEHTICPSLSIGEQCLLMFPTFTPFYAANYSFTYFTQLSGDDIRSNDTLVTISAVGLVYNVRPTEVLSPTAVLNGDPFQPQVVISNVGNMQASSFFSYCRVFRDSIMIFDLSYQAEGLEAGEIDTAVFQQINVLTPGQYCFQFITDWQDDQHPEDDTLTFWAEYPAASRYTESQQVQDFQVEGSFPNPFNLSTSFKVTLSYTADVIIRLFKLDGSCVKIKEYAACPAGENLLAISTSELPSGIYFAEISAGSWQQTKKIVLVK